MLPRVSSKMGWMISLLSYVCRPDILHNVGSTVTIINMIFSIELGGRVGVMGAMGAVGAKKSRICQMVVTLLHRNTVQSCGGKRVRS